jgi:hypothetical protein
MKHGMGQTNCECNGLRNATAQMSFQILLLLLLLLKLLLLLPINLGSSGEQSSSSVCCDVCRHEFRYEKGLAWGSLCSYYLNKPQGKEWWLMRLCLRIRVVDTVMSESFWVAVLKILRFLWWWLKMAVLWDVNKCRLVGTYINFVGHSNHEHKVMWWSRITDKFLPYSKSFRLTQLSFWGLKTCGKLWVYLNQVSPSEVGVSTFSRNRRTI